MASHCTWDKIQLLSVASVDSKKKITSSFTSKNGFIQEQQRIAIWDKQTTAKAIDKSNKGEERYVIEKRRRLGGVVLNSSPLEKSKSSGR